jgi:deazaflavin-dependent oxidoreductase (nitroreductase family)
MPDTKLPPWTPGQERVANVFIKIMTALNIWVFRLSGGRIGSRFARGAPVCLVTTTGRKSGAQRTVALIYLADGPNVVIVASKGGMAKHPIWYLNLVANPRCTVELGSERHAMVAHTASAAEKQSLWPRLVAIYRDYDDYQARTVREIPVVILAPEGNEAPRADRS